MENDVERLLDMQQTGEYIPTKEEQEAQDELLAQNAPGSLRRRMLQFNPELEAREEVRSREAAAAGYGQSRYDTGEFIPGEDLEHKRAIDQPGFWKIANGAVKGGVYAATTAVETVAGVVDGLLEGGYELARQIGEGEGISGKGIIGKGVDNFTARTMQNIQRLSDEWFPNYRTAEERSPEYQDEWLKHIFTANFIGDSFLKNFGFTVGALAGGSVWNKVLTSGLKSLAAGNLLKGVTAAAEGNAEAAAALKNTLGVINSGAAQTIDAAQLAKNIDAAARSLNKMKSVQAITGSVIAAMGEGTMEGVMARDEFLNNYISNLNQEYIESVRNATSDEERQALAEDYNEKRKFAENEADKVAATTFLLNLPILISSNTIQFGKMFSGGFKTARNVAKVTGGITNTGGKIAAKYGAEEGSAALRAAMGSLKVGTSEATEEMLQGVVSSGAKNVADARITAFNDDAYDPEVLNTVGAWFSQMAEGGADYLSDWKNWQEGFLGMVTGLIGMPGRTWSGGIPGAVREAREETSGSAEAAAALNNRINTDKFENAWKGYVRHLKYENEMEEAVKHDDQYAWATANDKQLINDVMMFANAGRLQDLKDIVDVYANMTDAEAEQMGVTDAVTSEENEKQIKNNPQAAISKVREQATNIKNSIDLYTDLYDAMSARAPMGTTPKQLEELSATAMNIKSFENRFLTMFDKVIAGVEKYVKPLSLTDSFGEEIKDATEQLQRAKDIRSSLAEIYTGTGIPVDTPVVEALGTINTLNRLRAAVEASGDTDLINTIDDMKKVAADRKKFLRKMLTLQELSPEKFEKQAQTPEKVIDQQKIERAKQETEGLDTLNDIKLEYFRRKASEKKEFLDNISAIEDSNPVVKEFLNIKRKLDGFQAYTEKNGLQFEDSTVTPTMISSAVNDLLRKATSEEDLEKMPDSMFTSLDDFMQSYTSIFGAPNPKTFEYLKDGIRRGMAAYLGIDAQTATRNTISPTPATVQPEPGTVSTPSGYDAAQPGSLEPSPTKETPAPAQPAPAPTPAPVETPAPAHQPSSTVDDAIDAGTDTVPQEVIEDRIKSSNGKNLLPFYGPSVPEVATTKYREARKAIRRGDREALKQINLNDFVEDEPGFQTTWDDLIDNSAFDNTARVLKVGDEVEFVVDPKFRPYDGEYQILMTIVRDGNRLVLNTLPRESSKYYGLGELRKAIDAEYSAFINEHPNELFVFSKKSRVWAKRPGLIDYDFSGKEEKGIRNIPSYDENAPIVFIDRNGNGVVVNKPDNKAADQVSAKFNQADYNRGDVDGIDRRGNLYYLSEANNTKDFVYVPIRLNVEHFKSENKDASNEIFNSIRDELTHISEIVAAANNENYKGQDDKLRKSLASLDNLLDLNGVYFEIGEYNNIGVALKIIPNYTGTKTDEEATVFRRPDQISSEWLINYISGLNRSVQIKLDNGSLMNMDKLIESDILTSNARKLRPKNVGFFINPWTGSEFAPVTEATMRANSELESLEETPETEEEETGEEGLGSFSDNEFLDVETVSQKRKQRSDDIQKIISDGLDAITKNHFEAEYNRQATLSFSELPAETQSSILAKGYTEEEYNNTPALLRDRILKCL